MTDHTHDVTQALVLAAGRGRRLNHDQPKPLYPLLGVPLLARSLFTLEAAGITDAYVVLGHEADEVRAAIDGIDQLKVRVHWLYNADWKRPNGLSVLTAESLLDRPFILAMGDHLFESGSIEVLTDGARSLQGVDLLVDRRHINGDHDLAEATKVRVDGDRIVEIGKSLDPFDGLDTGLFLAAPEIFGALREACAEGGETLSDGVQKLAAAGRARAIDGGDLFWHDIDEPEDARVAQSKLLAGLRTEKDGPIASVLNRPISTRISAQLAKTSITPNQVSLATLLVGVIAAVVVAGATYPMLVFGGVLFHFASVLDGVDGEVARLKFQASKRGEYVDTACDSIAYVAFLAGLTVAAYRAPVPEILFWNGVAATTACTLGLANIAVYLSRQGNSGSARTIQYGYQKTEKPGVLAWFLRQVHYLGTREMFSFGAMVAALSGFMLYGLVIPGVLGTIVLIPITIKILARTRRPRAKLPAAPTVRALDEAASPIRASGSFVLRGARVTAAGAESPAERSRQEA
jgi:CDP-L-myo-inositol myo-inositolphosphotransferase